MSGCRRVGCATKPVRAGGFDSGDVTGGGPFGWLACFSAKVPRAPGSHVTAKPFHAQCRI